MIESSFAMQYPQKDLYAVGDDDMEYREFVTLLSGIMPETPLGQIIKIRAEDDPEILQHYSTAEHEIRNKWRSRQVQEKMKHTSKEEAMAYLKEIFKSMAE